MDGASHNRRVTAVPVAAPGMGGAGQPQLVPFPQPFPYLSPPAPYSPYYYHHPAYQPLYWPHTYHHNIPQITYYHPPPHMMSVIQYLLYI